MDYIRRDLAKGAVATMLGLENVYIVSMISEAISMIPAADVEEVRRGEWIKKNNVNYSPFDGSPEYIYICSVCGREENKQEPYCNCGAKMDGGNDETT